MKKITALVLCLLVALVFCSCNKAETGEGSDFVISDEISAPDIAPASDVESQGAESEMGIPEEEKPPEDATVIIETPSDFTETPSGSSKDPEENPKPVDITREDAYEMTAISYTDSLMGETLNFNASSFEIFTDKDIKDGVAVIRSTSEMKKAIKKHAAAEEKHIESFTDEFFKENAIIMLSHKQRAVDEYTIYDIVIKENTACVIIECGDRSVNGADACYITYIEVNKKDLAKAKYLTVNMME